MATALTIPLDERGALSLQQQLYTRLRDDILARRLRPGERLPPSRTLAAQLAVSRTTVVLVYDQLVAEGYPKRGRAPGRSSRARSRTRRWWRRAGRTCVAASGARGGDASRPRRMTCAGARRGSRSGAAAWPTSTAWSGARTAASPSGTARCRSTSGPGGPDWDTFPRQVWGRLTLAPGPRALRGAGLVRRPGRLPAAPRGDRGPPGPDARRPLLGRAGGGGQRLAAGRRPADPPLPGPRRPRRARRPGLRRGRADVAGARHGRQPGAGRRRRPGRGRAAGPRRPAGAPAGATSRRRTSSRPAPR